MRTRFPSSWVVCFFCLTTVACLRSLDGNKVPCTTSVHCPSGYTCLDGYCSRGSSADSGRSSDAVATGDGPRAERGDTGLIEPDSATPAMNPDTLLPSTGGAGDAGTGGTSGVVGTTGVDGGSGLAGDAPVSSVASIGGTTTGGIATNASIPKTGGATGTDGVTSTAGSMTGGAAVTSTGTASAGGASATSSAISSNSKAGASASATTVTGGASSSSIGGTSASGGASSSGGTTATGGVSSSSASTCQPKPRDCTSTLDNNCNGTPDNQETTYCACPAGQKRDCQEHPGYDGKGPCKAGSQTCQASGDKTTSAWNDCSGAIAPSTEVCDAAGVDENCDGQPNEGCECVNGTSIPCDCGPATTCMNGKKGTCSVSKVKRYRDADGDQFGDSARPAQVCPDASGYVDNANDCDDSLSSGASFYPGVSVCSTVTEKKSCPSTGGMTKIDLCDDGCINNDCRNDGTVGVPGYVSCTSVHTPRCLATDGCNLADGTCGAASDFTLYCDGPNDCPTGQKCWFVSMRSFAQVKCASSQPEYSKEVCDPKASTCTCAADSQGVYTCQ